LAATDPNVRRLSSSHAARSRWNKPTEGTARDLAAARAEDYIRKLVDAAPPLTDTQRSRLAVLLLSGGGAA
jgi:hypothetical protein